MSVNNAGRYRLRWGAELGATLVEYAIILPVLLLLLYAVLGISHLGSIQTTLTVATASARTAAARARLPNPPIDDINQYALGGAPSSRLQSMFASPGKEGTAFGIGAGSYADFLETLYGTPVGLEELSLPHLYALVYAIGIVRENLGGIIQLPCKEPGCLLCLPIPNPADPLNLESDFIGIKCQYRPSSLFMTPLARLLNTMGGYGSGTYLEDGSLVIERSYSFILQ